MSAASQPVSPKSHEAFSHLHSSSLRARVSYAEIKIVLFHVMFERMYPRVRVGVTLPMNNYYYIGMYLSYKYMYIGVYKLHVSYLNSSLLQPRPERLTL